MSGFIANVQWASRLMRRRPGFAATVVLTLGAAVAAVVTAYGVATAVLWRPLPFHESDQLVFIWENTGAAGEIEPARATGFRFDQWQRGARSFTTMALFGAAGFVTDREGAAVSVSGVRVSTNYFDTIGISPEIGRAFLPDDGEEGARRVVILSDALWKEWFAGSGDAIGRDIRLNGGAYTIVGVMPPVVFPAWPVNPAIVTLDPESRRLWVPLERTPALAASARAHVYGVVARLEPGRSLHDAGLELTRMVSGSDPDRHGAIVRPFRDQFVRGARVPLVALLGATLALLLVGCTNLAALQGSAIESRRQELGIRAALGAGRRRLLWQFSIEALMLAAPGGVLGVMLSRIALLRVPGMLPPSVPVLTTPAIDPSALSLAAAIVVATAAALAAWPFARTRTTILLAPRSAASVARSVALQSLVIIQVAFAMALVASAALLQQSLDTVRGQDPGFNIDRVLVGDITLPRSIYAGPFQVVTAQRRLAAALATIPGAGSIAFAYDHPLEANWIDSFTIVGSVGSTDDVRGAAQLRIVSPSYFDTMGVAVIDGRVLTERDELGTPGAVVVNEAFARRVTEGPVLNRTLRSGAPGFWNDSRVPSEFRIVGIVEDERFKGLEQPSEPAVYMSTYQFPQQQLVILIRCAREPGVVAGAVRAVVKKFDPQVPAGTVTALSSILADQLATRRATTHVIDGIAAGALALAGLGLYGLLALLVSARRRETGIRLALGSSPAIEASRVFRQCLASAGLGVLCGLCLALIAGRLVQSLLVGVSPRDMTTLAAVSAAMLGVGGVAALLPAWGAARADPAAVLRGEA